ncbi:MAG: hypothetical protein WD004_03670 [Actinomycetota bacterium]
MPLLSLVRYASECLEGQFDERGLALQDVVNELGRRLDYQVVNGRYRGTPNQVGFDGLWTDPLGYTIVVEVKSSDVHRFDIDAIARYREQLVESGDLVLGESSVLIVVGRENTGGLEAEIRGSRSGWDTRLISVDGLVRLATAFADTANSDEARILYEVVRPRQFTRVDTLIDLVVSSSVTLPFPEPGSEGTDRVDFRSQCFDRIQASLGAVLRRETQTIHVSEDGGIAVMCAVSREYPDGGYWFGFHPSQLSTLQEAQSANVAFGCGTAERIFMFPLGDWIQWLPDLWKSARGHWHVRIEPSGAGWLLRRSGGREAIDISQYELS